MPVVNGEKEQLDRERGELLARLEAALEIPMAILGLVWLALMVLEFIRGQSPYLERIGVGIWAIFVMDFGLKFLLATEKPRYLRNNILVLISLLFPALRVFRLGRMFLLFRATRFVRSIRLVKVLSALNRGLKGLSIAMNRRGLGYVLTMTLLVLFGGTAGMYALEGGSSGLKSPSEALWWTSMILTTMGSAYWPTTPEGRVLCIFISLYSMGSSDISRPSSPPFSSERTRANRSIDAFRGFQEGRNGFPLRAVSAMGFEARIIPLDSP